METHRKKQAQQVSYTVVNKRQQQSCIASFFTLIELLLIIAIIAILAAMLFPALRSAKNMAIQADCISKMKQVGLATSMYLNDYNTMFWEDGNSPNAPPTTPYTSWSCSWWFIYIDEQYTNQKFGLTQKNKDTSSGTLYNIPNTVYYCQANPPNKKMERRSTNYVCNRDLWVNPTKNYFLQGKYLKCPVPEQVSFITEGNLHKYQGMNASQGLEYNYNYYLDLLYPPHNGTSNVLFLDWHVDKVKGVINTTNIGKFNTNPTNW